MAPTILGKYEVRGVLGRGAAGIVYDAWDPVISRRVAIKTVKLPGADDIESEEELGRFRREAQAAGRLSHPNIVPVYDYGETDEIAYIVMEHIDGGSLKGVMDKAGQVPPADALRIMQQLLAGLQFSHDRGIVHRDIKPANVMMTAEHIAKITDFGIARIEGSGATMVGTMLGTPTYMSPEQWRGDAEIDARSDIYAAGVLLYHMLTGRRPFDGGNQSAIMHQVLTADLEPPSHISVSAPPELDAVVIKAMARKAEDRYQSAASFADGLARAMSGGAGHDGDATLIATPRPKRAAPSGISAPAAMAQNPSRRKTGVMIAAVVGALVVIGGGMSWLMLGDGKSNKIVAVTDGAMTKPLVPAQVNDQAVIAPMAPAVAVAQVAPPAPTLAVTPLAPAAPPVAPVAQPAPEKPPVQIAAPSVPVLPTTPSPPPTVTIPAPIAPPTPPLPLPVAPPSAATFRQTMAETMPPCTPVYGDVTVERLALRGIAPSEHLAALRSVYDRSTAQAKTWEVLPFPALPIYCRVIDVMRPSLRGLGDMAGVKARLLPSPTTRSLELVENDPIDFEVTGPNFPSVLQVDYIENDDKVSHYMPRKTAPAFAARRLRAGERVRLFDTAPSSGAFQAGPPIGTDLVVIIASSEPIDIARVTDDEETVAYYAEALRTGLDAARRRGVRVSIEIVPVVSINTPVKR